MASFFCQNYVALHGLCAILLPSLSFFFWPRKKFAVLLILDIKNMMLFLYYKKKEISETLTSLSQKIAFAKWKKKIHTNNSSVHKLCKICEEKVKKPMKLYWWIWYPLCNGHETRWNKSVCDIASINFFEYNISWTIKYYFLSIHFS